MMSKECNLMGIDEGVWPVTVKRHTNGHHFETGGK